MTNHQWPRIEMRTTVRVNDETVGVSMIIEAGALEGSPIGEYIIEQFANGIAKLERGEKP